MFPLGVLVVFFCGVQCVTYQDALKEPANFIYFDTTPYNRSRHACGGMLVMYGTLSTLVLIIVIITKLQPIIYPRKPHKYHHLIHLTGSTSSDSMDTPKPKYYVPPEFEQQYKATKKVEAVEPTIEKVVTSPPVSPRASDHYLPQRLSTASSRMSRPSIQPKMWQERQRSYMARFSTKSIKTRSDETNVSQNVVLECVMPPVTQSTQSFDQK